MVDLKLTQKLKPKSLEQNWIQNCPKIKAFILSNFADFVKASKKFLLKEKKHSNEL